MTGEAKHADDPIPAESEPLWRRDFPYDAAAEEEVTRREFARYLALGAGAMAAGNVVLAAWTQLRRVNTGEPRPIVALDKVEVGGTYLFRYPGHRDPAILLRHRERAVVGFSQKCTHLGCVVYFQPAENRWHCPCHEGSFEPLSGRVISGPPTRALGRIDLEIRDDVIWALGAHT